MSKSAYTIQDAITDVIKDYPKERQLYISGQKHLIGFFYKKLEDKIKSEQVKGSTDNALSLLQAELGRTGINPMKLNPKPGPPNVKGR